MTEHPEPAVHVIGAGPAGLMAAETLARAGARVVVHDRMPSVGRKFLMAGRGGLNLTHTEDQPAFLARYGPAESAVAAWLDAFSPDDLIAWAHGLEQPTFVGSSGRVFPRAMKASPLLRAWLGRLAGLGVEIRTRSRWTGWRGEALVFETPEGERIEHPAATVMATGGASWPRLGSDGAWVPLLESEGVAVAPLVPANAGFDVAWSEVVADRFAGAVLKPVTLTFGGRSIRGEVVLTRYGIEGGPVYGLSSALRAALAADGGALVTLDLRPDLTEAALAERLARPRGKDSMTNHLRKAGGLSAAAIGVLREIGDIPPGFDKLAKRIKAVRLKLTGIQGLDRAISTAGGVRLEGLDPSLMTVARPGVFVAGEMIDWEAPTGGYLLQASLASGVVAAEGALRWRASQTPDMSPA
ncbi:NAD(P)/FAD-dependent oxidoreductase [Brevundimonas subvibrioides]|uniref:HI0933 family protein n=1 Tax=Brevundimonas subvibrioides (strain ATCC 15264 / DSM 4735 / LMG 14903 / NBRC 16000 / CB 81) TaxID=633149 RepID=D9QKD8_BRESC|nr:TIGR03862 family flavoprotein [Brevundimonas subvibrioides]ADK99763.1 HI0933 family protein [Brevundimonas subvibrioides ATCC 15264]